MEELREALDKVLAHRETFKDTIAWPIIGQTNRVTHEDARRLKVLLGDMDALAEASHRYLPTTEHPASKAAGDSFRPIVKKVFGTPELLEAILQHLSVPDLLRAEDTCKTFRARSPGLQSYYSSSSGLPMTRCR